MKKKGLTKEEIIHLARLAGLSLTDKEIEKYESQLEETISYIENLNELPTEKVSPTSHTTLLNNVYFNDGEKNERLLGESAIFQNAKNKEKNYFQVKKIFDE
jgi:aspartyl-tRNA(Asn)/glutamyl-tRNA(Gln) amidotransferase subunit C